MDRSVADKIPQVVELCKKHQVATMYLFGSSIGEAFNENSDIDVMVSFCDVELLKHFDNLLSFKQSLEKLFARSIDLLEESAIRNPVLRRSIDLKKELIYGRAD